MGKSRLSIIAALAAVAAFAMLTSCSGKPSGPRVSIFAAHVSTVASQEHISFAEAAAAVRAIGYEGADVWVTQDEDQLRILDSVGFAHSCCIAEIDYCSGADVSADEERALEFMRTHGYDRILIVPGLYRGEDTPDVSVRLGEFAARAAAEGLTVAVEDYDNPHSPCFDTGMLSGLFAAAPELMHNFDSGNYIIAGEDCLEAVRLFRDRIAHVHLKDRVSENDMSCPAIGSGCIPEAEAIAALADSGYDGWLTVEHFGHAHMLEAAEESYRFISSCLAGK